MVFAMMGAILMSKKVKDWNTNIYPHLIKIMDSHYTAIGIAFEAQQYVDWGVKMDDTISHDTASYARRPLLSSWINRRTEPKQPPRSNNRPTHSQQCSSSKHGRDCYQTNRMHNHNNRSAICRNYTRGLACFNIRNCPYRTQLRLRPMLQQIPHPQTPRNRTFGSNNKRCDGSSHVLPP